MRRDWSLPGDLNPATGLYEPHMMLQTQVTPVYRFFNGQSQFYQFGTPATPGANGRVLMAGPLGSINDAGREDHRAEAPRRATADRSGHRIPAAVEDRDLLPDGRPADGGRAGRCGDELAEQRLRLRGDRAVHGRLSRGGAEGAGAGLLELPRRNAHGFAALGYTPLATRNGKPLCSSCHGAKTASFTTIHQKHVIDKRWTAATATHSRRRCRSGTEGSFSAR